MPKSDNILKQSQSLKKKKEEREKRAKKWKKKQKFFHFWLHKRSQTKKTFNSPTPRFVILWCHKNNKDIENVAKLQKFFKFSTLFFENVSIDKQPERKT